MDTILFSEALGSCESFKKAQGSIETINKRLDKMTEERDSDICAMYALQDRMSDLSSRFLEVEADTHAAHNKINAAVNSIDAYLEDMREAIKTTITKWDDKDANVGNRLETLEKALQKLSDYQAVCEAYKK